MGNTLLSPKIKNITDAITKDLLKVYGHELVAVILHGSAAGKDFSEKNSNLNILAVLNEASLKNIAKAKKTVSQLKYARVSLLFFDENYILSSTDVFPIEFLDMKANYILLFGKDVLKDIHVDTKNLRVQVEQELRSLLIKAKHIYPQTANSGFLLNILFRYFTSFMHIAKNMLRLKAQQVPDSKADILNAMENIFKTDISVLKEILALKTGAKKINRADFEALYFKFVDDLEKAVKITDEL